jgi:hypothetical protein
MPGGWGDLLKKRTGDKSRSCRLKSSVREIGSGKRLRGVVVGSFAPGSFDSQGELKPRPAEE